MEYPCDSARAQEIARLVLPIMTRLGIPMTPINYALWYEYCLERTPELVQALAPVASGEVAYDYQQAHALFKRYVAGEDPGTVQRVETEVRRLLADIVQIIRDAGLELSRYSAVLGSCGRRLESCEDLRDLRRLVQSIVEDTQAVAASNSQLAGALKERASEIDQLRGELERVRQEAVKDPLTGLANRRAFDERLAESLDASLRQMKTICLMLIDIDHFKTINDRHGHQIGDKILQFVASVLRKNFAGEDVVARYGGDEFAVIVDKAPPGGVAYVAETVRRQVEASQLKRTDTGEPVGRVTVSIGYDYLHNADTTADALDRADKALYRAKQGGRNQVKSFSD